MIGGRASQAWTIGALAAAVVLLAALWPTSLRPFAAGLAGASLTGMLALIVFRAYLRKDRRDSTRLEIAAIGGAAGAGFFFLFQNVLVHDALWYYGYLRSAIVEGNFDLYDEFVLRNPNGMYLPPPEAPIFYLGTSLLQAPAALIARQIAVALARLGYVPGGDGYGPIEVGAATFTSMMLAIGGVALTHRLARRLTSGPVSAVAQIALLFASPLAFFAFVWPGYPHPATVFLGALFLLLWSRPAAGGRGRDWLLGLVGGLLAIVHPQDVVYLALPVMDLLLGAGAAGASSLTDRDSPRSGPATLAARARCAGMLALGFAAGFAPQIAAWIRTSGRILADVYGEIGDPFIWSHPAFWDVLFSSYNGLVTWTPLCGAAVAGLILLRGVDRRLFRGLVLLLVLQWWAIASYGYWWGGASFGARYFLSAYPALGVGLALALHRLGRRAGLALAGLATVPFVYWNLLLMAQFRLEWIPHNQPPNWSLTLRRQIVEAPGALLDGLAGAFRWNRVLMLDLLRAAAERGSLAATLAWSALAAVLLIAIHRWIALLVGTPVATRPRRRAGEGISLTAAATGTAVSAAATLLVFALSGRHGARTVIAESPNVPLVVPAGGYRSVPMAPPRRERDPLHATAVILDPSGAAQAPRTARVPIPPAFDAPSPSAALRSASPSPAPPTALPIAREGTAPASTQGARALRFRPVDPVQPLAARPTLDLVSFLRRGESRREGETVARIDLSGPTCEFLSLPVRAGIETAETAPDRYEVEGRIRHGIEKTDPVQTWWQDDLSARHYFGHAYFARWSIPAGCETASVSIRAADGVGELEVRRLVISIDRGGS